MSPRVVPKSKLFDARATVAVEDWVESKDRLFDEVLERHDLHPARGITVSERAVYGPESEQSWYRDHAICAAENLATGGFDVFPNPQFGGPEEARRRLATVETRTLTTTPTGGGNFAPPAFLIDAFAAAVRANSVLADILPENTLPFEIRNETLFTPRITTGTTAAVQNPQNAATSNQDIIESMVANPIATCSGQQDVSQQLLDHSNIDVAITRDIGAALGAARDAQLLAGTGANSQALGLISVTGKASTSYTDATATQAEAFPTILSACAAMSVALGKPADVIAMHPRRRDWFLNWRDSATGMQSNLNWPCRVVEVPAISTSYGAGTEDYVLVLRSDELPIYLESPHFRVNLDIAGSNTLTAKFTVYQYVAGLFTRRPEAISQISGTGFIAAVFS